MEIGTNNCHCIRVQYSTCRFSEVISPVQTFNCYLNTVVNIFVYHPVVCLSIYLELLRQVKNPKGNFPRLIYHIIHD